MSIRLVGLICDDGELVPDNGMTTLQDCRMQCEDTKECNGICYKNDHVKENGNVGGCLRCKKPTFHRNDAWDCLFKKNGSVLFVHPTLIMRINT